MLFRERANGRGASADCVSRKIGADPIDAVGEEADQQLVHVAAARVEPLRLRIASISCASRARFQPLASRRQQSKHPTSADMAEEIE